MLRQTQSSVNSRPKIVCVRALEHRNGWHSLHQQVERRRIVRDARVANSATAEARMGTRTSQARYREAVDTETRVHRKGRVDSGAHDQVVKAGVDESGVEARVCKVHVKAGVREVHIESRIGKVHVEAGVGKGRIKTRVCEVPVKPGIGKIRIKTGIGKAASSEGAPSGEQILRSVQGLSKGVQLRLEVDRCPEGDRSSKTSGGTDTCWSLRSGWWEETDVIQAIHLFSVYASRISEKGDDF